MSGWSPPGGPEPQDKGPDSLSFLGDSWSGAVVRRVLSGPGSARVEPREVRPRPSELGGGIGILAGAGHPLIGGSRSLGGVSGDWSKQRRAHRLAPPQPALSEI